MPSFDFDKLDTDSGDKQPYIQWYGRDYLGDPDLQLCSLMARGFAANFFSYTGSVSRRRGCFVIGTDDRAPTIQETASIIHCSPDEAERAIAELTRAGVIRRTSDGVLYSARQVREAKRSDSAARSAKARWSDRELVQNSRNKENQKDKRKRNANEHANVDAKSMRSLVLEYGSGSGSDPDQKVELIPSEKSEAATPAALEKPHAWRGADVDRVVEHYRSKHPRSKPGDVERKAIIARFKEGWSADELIEAIEGCHVTPHNIGENDRGEDYLGLGLIMRKSDQVQRFIGNWQKYQRGELGAKTRPKNQTAAERQIEAGLRLVEEAERRAQSGESRTADALALLRSKT